LICLLLSGAFCIYIGLKLNLPVSFLIVCVALIFFIIFFFGRFILNPTNKNNTLKNTTLAYTTFLFFNMLVHILVNFPIDLNL